MVVIVVDVVDVDVAAVEYCVMSDIVARVVDVAVARARAAAC